MQLRREIVQSEIKLDKNVGFFQISEDCKLKKDK